MTRSKLTLTLILSVAVALPLFSRTKQNKSGDSGPVAAYRTPKSDNAAEQALRLKRDEFYRRFTFGLPGLDQFDGGGVGDDCYAPGVRERHSLESKTIVIGKVTGAKAYFSDDRRNVYTELLLKVESIIRDKSTMSVAADKEITIARWGGKILWPSGKIYEWGLRQLGMPKVGQRYLVFLEPHADEQFFYLWTAYGLTRDGIVPIDKLDESKMPPSSYKGTDETKFLQIVKASIKE